ncbi:MAG TPA: phenylalanine--tRNA ligase subunit alpha [Candidatus Saccharimonadales bacterium]|nr:phenylalanine--tRNA ligase subunit alpha [Candidatus Saccharimonadales bacterium]
MSYQNSRVASVAEQLKQRLHELSDKTDILKAPELKALYTEIPTLPPEERGVFGKEVNALRAELQAAAAQQADEAQPLPPIDITAPFDINVAANKRPQLLTADHGSQHPLMREIKIISDIFYRMGFTVAHSRQLDDEYHMFTSLNFPAGHPARDDYDTFMTEERDSGGHPFIAPAHTSTMQNRLLIKYKANLEQGRPIAALVPDRVFRNEDLDARHEHTFYQFEGIYVDKGVHAGHLMATLKTFLQEYFNQQIEIKTQPFYFPFTEPSFEFALSCPFCKKQGCNVCSYSGWIELLGCGMIHPNVLKMAGIDPEQYTGFAWGSGVERLVMMKYDIEDVRHFEGGKLEFLRQFS